MPVHLVLASVPAPGWGNLAGPGAPGAPRPPPAPAPPAGPTTGVLREGSYSGGASDLTNLLEIADRWLLRGSDLLTLAPTGDLTLPAPAGRVAFAPGGQEAYALAALGTKLLRLDLASGSVSSLRACRGGRSPWR